MLAMWQTLLHRHTTSLHDLYVYPQEIRGARWADNSLPLPSDTSNDNVATSNANVKQIHTSNPTMLTRISALTVINPQTQDRIQVYAQHDPASAVTLVSSSLAEELDLSGTERSRIILHTVSGSKASELQRILFEIETLHTGRAIKVQNAWCWMLWRMKTLTCHTNMILQPTHTFIRRTFQSYQKGPKWTFL